MAKIGNSTSCKLKCGIVSVVVVREVEVDLLKACDIFSFYTSGSHRAVIFTYL